MLHERRVSTGRRRPLPSYVRPLCLIAVLLHGRASAAADPLSRISGARRQRPRVAAVGSSGGDVGVTMARTWGIPSKVWTAAVAAALQEEGWSRLVPTATALADPSADARLRERARRLLLSLRGGSEGLKSEKWNREKAAAGEARKRRGASGGVGEVRSLCISHLESSVLVCTSARRRASDS